MALYDIEAIRACEQRACAQGISEYQLMTRAAEEALKALKQFYPEVKNIVIYCGTGNNAGDGFLLAALAKQAGFQVVVCHIMPLEMLPTVARAAATRALDVDVLLYEWDHDAPDLDYDLVVDALFGIGLDRPLAAPYTDVIHYLNGLDLPVISLDVPSGVHVDTGSVMGAAVVANLTVTFIANKIGLYMADGPDYAGRIVCATLGLEPCLAQQTAVAGIIPPALLQETLVPRKRNVHKRDFGHVLVIGGGLGMPGAPCLAAEAALRSGAGLVHIACHPAHVSMVSHLPEAMIAGAASPDDLEPLLDNATVCVIGPGLGVTPWAHALFDRVMCAQLPTLFDASALHILAENPQYDDNWILTPHPGEAAVLLGTDSRSIQQNRMLALKTLSRRFGGTIVLKGVGTLVSHEDTVFLCDRGNPGMSTAGMGDILSGIIAGFMAQGLTLSQAARAGVLTHAAAADHCAAEMGFRGLLARDILPYVQQIVSMKTPVASVVIDNNRESA